MNKEEFINSQSSETKEVFNVLDQLICKYDPSISSEVGSMMSIKEALVYKQENVYKYGVTSTKNHYSYHSMVMYVFPDVVDDFKAQSKGIKFQKGCFNFNSLKDIDLLAFEKVLRKSAEKDFSSVINHYKKKRK